MQYYLFAHHFAAVCARDLVLLDARAGDYLLLAGAGDHVELGGSEVTIHRSELAEALYSNGILSTHPTGDRPAVPDLPMRSVLDEEQVREGGLAWRATAAAALEMPFRYHAAKFPALLARARAMQTQMRVAEFPDPRLAGICEAFDRLSPWAPMPGECLFRSFMLLRILNRHGYAPNWVFGVRTWPFAAHCWLQAGPVALTDYADTLRAYTPIMAI
jgi:hypothetical protein